MWEADLERMEMEPICLSPLQTYFDECPLEVDLTTPIAHIMS
jgi:hypothetical protein